MWKTVCLFCQKMPLLSLRSKAATANYHLTTAEINAAGIHEEATAGPHQLRSAPTNPSRPSHPSHASAEFPEYKAAVMPLSNLTPVRSRVVSTSFLVPSHINVPSHILGDARHAALLDGGFCSISFKSLGSVVAGVRHITFSLACCSQAHLKHSLLD